MQETQIEETESAKKDTRKIWYLVIIIILLVGGSAIFYYFNRDKIPFLTKPKESIQRQTGLEQDFVNEKPKLTADVLPPDNIKERLNKQLEAYRQEIADQEAAEDGNPYSGYLGAANTIRQLGDFQAAEQEYLKVIDKYPKDYLVWHNIGVLYEDMHQYLSAAQAYTKSIALKPVEVLPHLKLARLYLKYSSHPDKVEEVLLKALQDTQDNREIKKVYASYLESKGRYQEALFYWQELLKDDPDNQAIKDRIADVESKL